MWKFVFVVGTLLTLAIPPVPVSAAFVDGNALLKSCETKEGSATYYQESSFCTAYVMGVSDTIDFYQGSDEVEKFICLPSGVTSGQLRDVVIQFLKKNPAERHKGAQSLAFVAMLLAFPCGDTE